MRGRRCSAARAPDGGRPKARSEWEEQEKQHALRESQLFASGGEFDYEPRHYAWCAAFTPLDDAAKASNGDRVALEAILASGRARLDPVTGAVVPFYTLCERANPRGDCEAYEPRA